LIAVRRARRAAVVALAALTGLAGSAATPRAAQRLPATAGVSAVRIVQPSGATIAITSLQGPPTARASSGAYGYPQDGSVLSIAGASGSAAVDQRHPASVATAEVTGLSLFAGELTADRVVARASARAASGAVSGDATGTAVENLVILGQAVGAAPNLRVPLGDWGQAVLLESSATPGTTLGVDSFTQSTTAIDIRLSKDHGGLPAGTHILVGQVRSFARVSLANRRSGVPGPSPTGTTSRPSVPAERPSSGGQSPEESYVPRQPDRLDGALPLVPAFTIPDINPHLTAGRYVFPVYGPVGYGDSFGAPRADTIWHHGDDIFAPLGAPVLAVADGTVYSVGWNDIGGNRLWVRDRNGNQFYYAHLSAFSPLAMNGSDVKAGDVLGFVGNSGDADGTAFHLHFEIHPAALLFLGYDGVIDPTPYLDAWRRLQDLRFPSGAAWAPAIAPSSHSPIPGAILLQATDISSASGLDPASLQRVLAPARSEGERTLTGLRRVGLDRGGAIRPASAPAP
jgi:murein DD-endopeptidase MepM/ murein hydrolase activator NlpD